MATVMQMLIAHMRQSPSPLSAFARRVTRTLVPMPQFDAQVNDCPCGSLYLSPSLSPFASPSISSETCKVNNGGCDVNSICSYDSDKQAIRCTCKVGFVDVDQSQVVVCKGRFDESVLTLHLCLAFDRCLRCEEWWMRCQCSLLA